MARQDQTKPATSRLRPLLQTRFSAVSLHAQVSLVDAHSREMHGLAHQLHCPSPGVKREAAAVDLDCFGNKPALARKTPSSPEAFEGKKEAR